MNRTMSAKSAQSIMKGDFEQKTRDLIIWRGQVVMSRSEEPFLRMLLAEVARHFEARTVLEVGYGLGISARLIQRALRPKLHDIVEIDPTIFRDLQAYAAARLGVRAIRGDWFTFRRRRRYDLIFHDPFEYDLDGDHSKLSWGDYYEDTAERAQELLVPGGVLVLPLFDTKRAPSLRRMRRVLFRVLRVPRFLREDGSRTGRGTFACYSLAEHSVSSR